MGLLHASGSGGGLAGSLGGQLLPGGLASGGLTGGLLGTSHGDGSDDTDPVCRFPPTYMARRGGDSGRGATGKFWREERHR